MLGTTEVIIKTILRLIKSKNISNQQLLDHLSLSEKDLFEMFSFKKELPIPILLKICIFLQTDMNEILLQSNVSRDHQLKGLEAKDVVYFKANFMSQWSRENLHHEVN